MPTYQLSSLSFRMMAWMFQVQNLLRPRERILAEINIKPGLRLLDYG